MKNPRQKKLLIANDGAIYFYQGKVSLFQKFIFKISIHIRMIIAVSTYFLYRLMKTGQKSCTNLHNFGALLSLLK